MIRKRSIKLKLLIVGVILLLLSIAFALCLPKPLFEASYSTVIYDNQGNLLGAHVAEDEQWRFPNIDTIPDKYIAALIAYEDKRFYNHPGVDLLAIGRALAQNLEAKSVVSGGSTITMQLMRMIRPANRTLGNKLLESIRALRLECTYSKDEILRLYASHAPFGGNIVGLEAAAWRYFGRSANSLSWAEAAMLAILPNAPGLVHMARNRDMLLEKRNRLLVKMEEQGIIDQLNLTLALEEPIPQHPFPIPQYAPHLLTKLIKQGQGKRYHTTIDKSKQLRVTNIIANHHKLLSRLDINNAAAIVLHIPSGEVQAYVGNTSPINGNWHQNHVDIIQSRRSTGSLLKPLLYAAAIDEGIILPEQLVADVPTYYSNFAPQNFTRTFDGAVPADQALSRSLNIPAVRLLMSYDIGKFLDLLQKTDLRTINKSANHYGLSLILGGAEATLFEFASVYAAMVRTINTFNKSGNKYRKDEYNSAKLLTSDKLHQNSELTAHPVIFSAGALYSTFQAMTEVVRPEEEQGWTQFASHNNIAWKTGTSFGFRDAWSLGVTSEYLVAVWVGNADGEGKPGIVGGRAAAPIMFDIFRTLPPSQWIEEPLGNMDYLSVCSISGYKASAICPTDTIVAPLASIKGELCPYHHLVHLDETKSMRVDSHCYPTDKMVHTAWFTLPPTMESYYSRINPLYQKLPKLHPQAIKDNISSMEIIYPQANAKLFLPIGLDGKRQPIVVRLAHRDPKAIIFWHLNGEYLGQTSDLHEMELSPESGKHRISFTDNNGNTQSTYIEIVIEPFRKPTTLN